MLEHVEEMFKLQLTTACAKDEREVDISRCRLQTEQHRAKVERALCDMKQDTERRRQEMLLDTERIAHGIKRRQHELALKMSVLQSRQALKNLRVSQAEIDQLLPLPAPDDP
ncbi:uncharacterized protein IUM83_09616 [Phytophthora cinnamomi]|uniref:uncharacterized protein n=1 Tax=Phytophthora cinnamomi TaxID=4785 RepID=UPI00355A85B2|nr:hypothetical protein IUM83_09616 [Phytophthora cinnamomi]